MFCPNCGKKIPEKSMFCPMCGFNIKDFFDESFKEKEEENSGQNIKNTTHNNELEDLFTHKDKVEENLFEKDDIKDIDSNNNFEETENELGDFEKADYLDDFSRDFKKFKDAEQLENSENESSYKEDFKKFEEEKELEDLDGYFEEEDIFDTDKKESRKVYKNTNGKNKYLDLLKNLKNGLDLKITSSQRFLNKKLRKFIYDMILEKNKYKKPLIILTIIALFIPLLLRLKVLFTTGKVGGNILVFLLIVAITSINVIVAGLGPFLSLKILNFNYIKNLDKNTTKAIVLISTFAISIISLILYIIFGEIVSMDLIMGSIFNNAIFTFSILITTILSILLKTYLLGVVLADKISEKKHFKVSLSILVGMVVAEVIAFLMAAPIISLLVQII